MVELNEFDENIVKKILTTGSTIKDAGKIAGNQNYLSQTKNKKTFGVEDFDSVGRAVQGKQRLYFMKNADYDEMIMKTFNKRLADELTTFYFLGYTLKDINYIPEHQVANITMIIPKKLGSSEFDEVTISFIDLTEIKYVVNEVKADSNLYRNLFVLPNIYTSGTGDDGDLSNILSMDSQESILKQPTDKFVIITESIFNDQHFYGTNVNGSDIHSTLTFIKQGGLYNKALFRDPVPDEISISDFDIVNRNRDYQLKTNGFYIDNGHIKELSNMATSAGVSLEGEDGEQYVGELLDQLGTYYPLAKRFYNKRYLPDTNDSVDKTLDNISQTDSAQEFQKGGNTFINFEANYLQQYIIDAQDSQPDADEENSTPDTSKMDAIFDKAPSSNN